VLALGVRRITGDVVVGDDDERDAPLDAMVGVTITGGAKDGDLAQISLDPDSAYFVVENGALTKNMAPRRVAKKVPIAPAAGKKGKKKKKFKTVYVTAPAAAALNVTLREDDADDGVGPHLMVIVTGRIRPGDSVRCGGRWSTPGCTRRTRCARTCAAPASSSTATCAARRCRPTARGARRARVGAARHAGRLGEQAEQQLPRRPRDRSDRRAALWWRAEQREGAARDGRVPHEARFRRGQLSPRQRQRLSYTNHLSVQQIVESCLGATSRERAHRHRLSSPRCRSPAATARSAAASRAIRRSASSTARPARSPASRRCPAWSRWAPTDDVILFAIMTNGFPNGRKKEVRAGQAAMSMRCTRSCPPRAESEHPTRVPVVAPLPDDTGAPPPPDGDGEQDDGGFAAPGRRGSGRRRRRRSG